MCSERDIHQWEDEGGLTLAPGEEDDHEEAEDDDGEEA